MLYIDYVDNIRMRLKHSHFFVLSDRERERRINILIEEDSNYLP
jgi:hypothetical protein